MIFGWYTPGVIWWLGLHVLKQKTITTRMTLSVYFRRSEKYYCELLSTVSLVTTLTKVSLQHGADLGGCYFLKSLVQYRLLLLIWCIYRTQLE